MSKCVYALLNRVPYAHIANCSLIHRHSLLAAQVGSRAERLGLQDSNDLYLYSATRLADILHEIVGMQPRQSLWTPSRRCTWMTSMAALAASARCAAVCPVLPGVIAARLQQPSGSSRWMVQVRECTTALLHVAKRERVPIFLVGHVTKQGDIAGPRVLEHIVDTVLYMEGERQQTFRLIRGIKNRYGATDEVNPIVWIAACEQAMQQARPRQQQRKHAQSL